jgi:hypothetical protein
LDTFDSVARSWNCKFNPDKCVVKTLSNAFLQVQIAWGDSICFIVYFGDFIEKVKEIDRTTEFASETMCP